MENKKNGFLKNAKSVMKDKDIPVKEKLPLILGKKYDFFMYVTVGGLTTVLNLVIYYLLINLTVIDPYTSTAIAWLVSMVFAFFVNKIAVFRDKDWSLKHAMYQFWTFTAARLLSFGVEELMLFVGIEVIGINENIIKIPIQVVVVLINYVASKLVIFRKKTDSADDAEKR